MKMPSKQQLMIGLNARANAQGNAQDLRQIVLGGAALARKPDDLLAALGALEDVQRFQFEETGTWLTAEDIETGASGPFDACDLGAWLSIARKAGISVVPARPILTLTEAEVEAASGAIELGRSPVIERARTLIGKAARALNITAVPETSVDPAAVTDKLFDAMDEVPEGWMARPQHCGNSELKALAGAGLAGKSAPEVNFGPGLEIGPGWVRSGNRRCINLQDRRVLELHAQGPQRGMTIYARPWVKAARYVEGEDPHRAGTPFAGSGIWPLEWRAFVRAGKVEGVSAYYGFVGEVSPANARMALKVRAAAEKIAEALAAGGLVPRVMNIEHSRRNPAKAELLEQAGFGRADISCTLDFIETDEGLMLLEAGPGASPVGGGHPCCFAGCRMPPEQGGYIVTEGVAFRPMSHVVVPDVSTWQDGDRTGAILSWDETEALAAA